MMIDTNYQNQLEEIHRNRQAHYSKQKEEQAKQIELQAKQIELQAKQEHEYLVQIQLSKDKLEKLGGIMNQYVNLGKLVSDSNRFKKQLELYLKNGGDLEDAVEIVLRVLRILENSLSSQEVIHFSVKNNDDVQLLNQVQQLVKDLLLLVHLPEDTIIVEITMDVSRDEELAKQMEFNQVSIVQRRKRLTNQDLELATELAHHLSKIMI